MSAAAETDDVEVTVQPSAGFGPRFAAWMIDACLLFGLQWMIVVILSRQLQAVGLSRVEVCAPSTELLCEGPNTALWAILFTIVVVSTFGYHAWFEGALGATPGKRWMGLTVVPSDAGEADSTIGIARGLIRSIARQGFWLWVFLFVAASPISIDVPAVVSFGILALVLATFVVGAFSASGAAIHDVIAGSRVVVAGIDAADPTPSPDTPATPDEAPTA